MIAALTDCCTVDRPCISRVPADRAAEITRLVRAWTGLQLVSCAPYHDESYPETYFVTTAPGPAFKVFRRRDGWWISQVY